MTKDDWLDLEDKNRCDCEADDTCFHQEEKFKSGDRVKVISPYPLEAPDWVTGKVGTIDLYTWDCGRHYVHVTFDDVDDDPEQHFAEWELELVDGK